MRTAEPNLYQFSGFYVCDFKHKCKDSHLLLYKSTVKPKIVLTEI